MKLMGTEYTTTDFYCPFFFPILREGMSLEDLPSCMKEECAMWVEWHNMGGEICGECGLVHNNRDSAR